MPPVTNTGHVFSEMSRIFVCEYVTGGGLVRETLSVALAAADDAMLR